MHATRVQAGSLLTEFRAAIEVSLLSLTVKATYRYIGN